MIGLDIQQKRPASATGLIGISQEEKKDTTLSFSDLLYSFNEDEKVNQDLLKALSKKLEIKNSGDEEKLSTLVKSTKKSTDPKTESSKISLADFVKSIGEDESITIDKLSTLVKNTKESTEQTKVSLADFVKSIGEDESIEKNSSAKKDNLSEIQKDKRQASSEKKTSQTSQINQSSSHSSLSELLTASKSSITDESLASQDLKILVNDAKNYLKNQILSTEGFQRSERENLPKTLNGLVELAEKIGIDTSKITLEEVRTSKQPTRVTSSLDKAFLEKKQTAPRKNSLDNQTANLTTVLTDKDLKYHNKKKDIPKENVFFTKMSSDSAETSKPSTLETKVKSLNIADSNISKKAADDPLKLLLQGAKAFQKDSAVISNSDFSVATARSLASVDQKSEVPKPSLESLLNQDMPTQNSEESSITMAKTDAMQVAKSDSLEVKMNEAKQMVKYLSHDVKQAIDDYKAPFTRVKVQLNPQQLGEIELTVVQRGKNLHVNLSSNNAAINTLAMNANDLKVQLQNSGINNASLNFSNNSQGGEAANGGQSNQQQQNRQQAQQEYNYFESEEQNEEILSSLEIIVPNYV